jgi:hypothetical protein
MGCSWLGRRWEILNHVSEAHKKTLILSKNNFCKIKNFLGHDHSLTTQVIVAYGELFWFHHEKDSSKSKFFGAVQYVGPKENAAKYKYEFEFSSTNPSGMKVKFSRNTHIDTEIINDVFRSEECLCVSILVTKHFVQEDILRFSLKVMLNEEDQAVM